MSLYINNKVYDKNSPINKLLDAIKGLPSPLPDVKKDFDDTIYDFEPQAFDMLFVTRKDGSNKGFDNGIIGKDGVIFSTQGTVDEECYRVAVGSVVFATDEKIGTYDVQDCVALIIQDINTKKTALVHVTALSSERFIKNVLSYLPSGTKEVVMIGDRYSGSTDRTHSTELTKSLNTKKILNVLLEYESDIFVKKAYIGDTATLSVQNSGGYAVYDLNTQGGNIIVDTKDLTLKPGDPAKTISYEGNDLFSKLYDLDRLLKLGDDKEEVAMYEGDMKNILYGIYKKPLEETLCKQEDLTLFREYDCSHEEAFL